MDQNIILLFIKILTFILLTWICNFYNDMNTLNKYLDERCSFRRKLNSRKYPLLAQYKQGKDLCIANSKEEIPGNEVIKQNNISNNKKGANGKHKQSCRSSLYVQKYGKNVDQNKCIIPKTKKYSDYEQKIFKELDYNDYLKNIKIIEDKEYKKVKRKKLRIRISLFFLFILVLMMPILDLLLEKLATGGLLGSLGLFYINKVEGAHTIGGVLSTLFAID
ncbi:fam-l protein [Plasmodium malariae]|uniref:Fam-l protein n=1 Tax=Plasmodium malariae TaxID=5858 RepID=A0A1D3P9Z6_PLAMA|nr:fam-l protein [Plasmodium malariae]SCN12005.1 fam-l protein [Plasmodium malariae]